MTVDVAISQRFFVLTEGAVGSRYEAEFEKAEPVNRADAPRCSLCGDIIGLPAPLPTA